MKDHSKLAVILNPRSTFCTAWALRSRMGHANDQSRPQCLKEQYPVTAHAPNFDFWTGCREIKRCEESKRTLKNPFASRLAEFNTTLTLLRITDQWYIVPVKFRFGPNLDFLALLLLPLARRSKRWEALWCRLKAYFFCQLPYKLR